MSPATGPASAIPTGCGPMVPRRSTAPVVQWLLDAGADLVGKTHTEELTWSFTGENAHYGAPVNVNAPGRVTGGSSSGSASVVAAGVVDFAVGSDTGGSVRLPASFCGILGMRPTYGRIPLDGVCPLAPSFDTCGWFARDVGVFERVGRTLLRDEALTPRPERVLIAQDAFEIAGDAVGDALRSAIDKVAAVVGMTEVVTVGDESLTRWMDCFRFLQGAEAWACHGEWITREKPAIGPGVKERFAWAATVGPGDITRASMRREDIARRMAEMLGERTVLALPSAPGIALLGTHRQKCSTTCALERCRSCASPAWHGCRKCRCRWRSSTVARSGCRSSPHAATIRSCSLWRAG